MTIYTTKVPTQFLNLLYLPLLVYKELYLPTDKVGKGCHSIEVSQGQKNHYVSTYVPISCVFEG